MFLSQLFSFVMSIVVAAAPGRSPMVVFDPEIPVQGHLFTIRVEASQGPSLASLSGTTGGEELHFVSVSAGVFESLAPVPIGTSDAVEVSIRVRYSDGTEETLAHKVPVQTGSYEHERLTVAPRLGGPLRDADAVRLSRDQAKAAEVARRAHDTPRLWSGSPVLPRAARVTSEFGTGRVYNGQVSGRHMGLDLNGDAGDTIVAPARGVVALVDEFLLAGNIVYLVHGGGLLSGYFHLSEQLVAVGDTVEAGTPIGRVGATGRVTGPHLHWVVRYGTTSVDPRSLMTIRPTQPER